MRSNYDHTHRRWGETREASSDGASVVRFGRRGDEGRRGDGRRGDGRRGDGRRSGGGGVDVDRRLLLLFALLALVVADVFAHLVYWQIIRGPEIAQKAELHRRNVITIPARRGTIYDRNGNVLAMSEECRTIVCNPQEITEPFLTAEVLASHLGGSAADYADSLTQDSYYVYVRRKVDTDVSKEIDRELREKKLPGVYFERDSRRVYPYGQVGGQVLGAVGIGDDGISVIGTSGLELYYEKQLHGIDGQMIVMSNNGIPIAGAPSEVTKEAIDGTDIVISLDIDVQRVAEEQIVEGVSKYKAASGSVMVTEPTTGEILAACSTPLLDASDLSVVAEGATSLKLVSDSFEPGSIFKVLTVAIGIEQGSVNPSSTFYVPAYAQVGDDLVADDDGRTQDMTMTLREILRRSSNAGAATVAQDHIGADAFAAGLEAFGIGQLTGIDFPGEVAGIVKDRSSYDGSSVGSMSFGQGLAIPLVQMVRAVGALANGGVPVTPHFLVRKGTRAQEWEPGARVVSQTTAAQVTDMMRTVVEEGTGTTARVPGYDVAAKTGTGEQADTSKGGYAEGGFTSSLIGYAPASNPAVLVYVGLNGTEYHAADSAGPLFSSIMGEALANRGQLPAS